MNNAHRLTLLGSAALLLAGLSGCGGNPRANALTNPATDPDSSVFAEVVKDLRSQAGATVLQIDPRPLVPDPALVAPVYSSADGAILSRRRAVLKDNAVPRALRVELQNCPGGMVARPTSTRGCPKQPETRAAIGMLRPGGAYFPGGRYDERERGIAAGESVVRVIVAEYTTGSSMLTAWDYVVASVGSKWQIQRRVSLFTSH